MSASDAAQALSSAIDEVGRLRATIYKGNRQIRSPTERGLVQATAFAWFNKHRATVHAYVNADALDAGFTELLESAEKNASRALVVAKLATLKDALVSARTTLLKKSVTATGAVQPNFAALISSPEMLSILKRRWDETEACLKAGAYLACTVMMGALLEALLLARINTHESKTGSLAAIYKCSSVPKDKNGKPLKVKEWKLFQFIDIAHEMGWIAKAAKDVGGVLREFRNYIHPHKELTDKIVVDKRETETLWNVFTALTGQIIASV